MKAGSNNCKIQEISFNKGTVIPSGTPHQRVTFFRNSRRSQDSCGNAVGMGVNLMLGLELGHYRVVMLGNHTLR